MCLKWLLWEVGLHNEEAGLGEALFLYNHISQTMYNVMEKKIPSTFQGSFS